MGWFTYFTSTPSVAAATTAIPTTITTTNKKEIGHNNNKKSVTTPTKIATKKNIPIHSKSKASCIHAKTTFVSVTVDVDNDNFAASRSLSVELAKRTGNSPSSSLSRSRRSSYTSGSDKSQRSMSLLHSASKASFSLLSTGISVTAMNTERKSLTALENLSSLKDELLADNNDESEQANKTSDAEQTKVADDDDKLEVQKTELDSSKEEHQKPQQKNDADIVSPSVSTTNMSIKKEPVHTQEERRWSWFRFSSYTSSSPSPSIHNGNNNNNNSNNNTPGKTDHQPQMQEQLFRKPHEHKKIELVDSPKAMSLKDQPSTSSSATTMINKEDDFPKKDNNPSLLSKGIAQQLQKEDETRKQTSKKAAVSPSSSMKKRRRNNIVLPKFETEFIAKTQDSDTISAQTKETSSEPTKKPNFIVRAIEAINSVLIEPPPPRDNKTATVDFDWLAKQMHTKFARFVEEIKSTDPTKKHNWVDKRITIIGTHGWFPMKLVRSMIGEPTGTSTKFCEQMSHCVKLYFEQEHQVTLPDDAITMVPLEGEGKIEDRVELLYQKLIDNPAWLEAVSSANVIIWATHSQGTPVSTILLQRLLERGHIHTFRQSVCMLAMAGISHGPFPSLRESLLVKYFEADAARELFEFMDSNSKISIKFRQSLSYILKRGTRVVLTGSMKDQVVPLYSAIMTATHHPNILRQLYIDEDLYSEKDFLVNLIVFLVKLRNRGLSDHHLLTYLSEILAGSLYAIEGGHSTIYEDLGVYWTAVRYTFETGPFGRYVRVNDDSDKRWWSHQQDAKLDDFQAQPTFNPYYLPWALQGICTDQEILKNEDLRNELKHLMQLFDQWKPTTAKLKDLKFKLEPFKSTPLM